MNRRDSEITRAEKKREDPLRRSTLKMSSDRPGVPGSKREIPKGRSGKESPGLGLLRAATEQAQVTRLLLKEISRALSLAPRAPFAKSTFADCPVQPPSGGFADGARGFSLRDTTLGGPEPAGCRRYDSPHFRCLSPCGERS